MIDAANKQANPKQNNWFKDNIWQDNAGFWATIGMIGSIAVCAFSEFTLAPAIGITLLTGGVMWGAIKGVELIIPILKQTLETIKSLKETVKQAEKIVKAVDPKQVKTIVSKLNKLEDKINKLIEADVEDELEENHADLKHLLIDVKKQLKKLDGIQNKISNAIEEEREFEDGQRPYDLREILDDVGEAAQRISRAAMIFRQPNVQEQPEQIARKQRPKPKQRKK